MSQGITLPDGLPDMSGTWYNPNTGEKIRVRDTFFENNELRVMTEDGRMLNYEIMQNYIKSVKDDDDLTEIIKAAQQKQYKEEREMIPQSVKDLLENYDDVTTGKLKDTQPGSPTVQNANIQISQRDPVQNIDINYTIIDKALGKKSGFTFTSSGMSWDNFPSKEISMLHEMMGISYDEITNYYINNMDIDKVKSIIKDCTIEYINGPVVPEVVTPPKKPVQRSSKSKK